MAEFTDDLQSFKPSLPFLEMDSNMELMNMFEEFNNPSVLENSNLNMQSFMGFSSESFLAHQQQPELPVNFAGNVPVPFDADGGNVGSGVQSVASSLRDDSPESKKRKVEEESENSSGNSSPLVSETALEGVDKINRKNILGRRKKGRNKEKALEKPKEVIHVRARRGQATDSHSLAERVRREKINEKLRRLQTLVPGCYKAMGMAVMLDEIINYLQSLKNQVDFLSMKLAAASSFYDFNSEVESMGVVQGTNAYEAQEMERLVREGYGGLDCFQSSWPL